MPDDHHAVFDVLEKQHYPDSAYNATLDSLRPTINATDIASLKKFYRLKYTYYSTIKDAIHPESALYADSLINLFTGIPSTDADRKAYFDALYNKGTELYIQGQFNQAAVYYLEARSLSEKYLDSCSYNGTAAPMANIYFIQDRYLLAARYYKLAYYGTINCKEYPDEDSRFFEAQSTVNTIGFAYERAGMLDSALYYYQVNESELKKAADNIHQQRLKDARVVMYDNLGSIYLKKGQYARAESLLTTSLNTPYSLNDGVRIPVLLKLADLYIIQKNTQKAKPALDSASKLLELFPSDLSAKLCSLQSNYHLALGNYAEAYQSQEKFIKINDILINNRDRARSVDIERDFLSIQQRASIQDLEQKDERKNSYLVLVILLCVLIVIIAILIEGNRRQSRNNHRLLVHQHTTLEQTLQKLELANTNYSNVLKVMAHDLKNPLTGIARIADIVIESEKQTESTREMFGIIKESADSAIHTINDLLNSALMNQGIEVLNKQSTDLSQLLQQCVALLKFRAEEKKQAIILSGDQHIHAFLDREKILRVLNNIIVNAIKFSPENSNILIALHQRQGIMISIADNGIGIPTEHAEHIFHPFTSARREGTAGEKPYGLGLSICKQIVEAHNGKLWFENNPTGGTIFYILLPTELS